MLSVEVLSRSSRNHFRLRKGNWKGGQGARRTPCSLLHHGTGVATAYVSDSAGRPWLRPQDGRVGFLSPSWALPCGGRTTSPAQAACWWAEPGPEAGLMGVSAAHQPRGQTAAVTTAWRGDARPAASPSSFPAKPMQIRMGSAGIAATLPRHLGCVALLALPTSGQVICMLEADVTWCWEDPCCRHFCWWQRGGRCRGGREDPEVRDQDKDNVSRPQRPLSDRSQGLHADPAGGGGTRLFLPRFLLRSQPQGREQSCRSS